MTINYDKKNLSRKREIRIEQRLKIDDNMRFLLTKIKSEKKKHENLGKIKHLEILLFKNKYASYPNNLQSEFKELNEIDNVDKNLHEIKAEILVGFTGEFEIVGSLVIGYQLRTTHITITNMDDFESYFNAIDQDYESDDAFFNRYFYKIKTPQFNSVNGSQYGSGCDFTHVIIEQQSNNCFIPTKNFCFVNCINYLTGEYYEQQKLDFIRNEKRRSKIMTKDRNQTFCRANNINIGYFVGIGVFPRSVTNRGNALFLHSNQFCLKWKSDNDSFNQAIKELKDNFKIVDVFITGENVNSHFDYTYTPKKFE